MDGVFFRQLQQTFRTEGLYYVSNAKGWATVAVEVCVFSLIAWGLSLAQPGGWAFIALEFCAGLSIFRWFVILHECGHKTLFRRLSVNTIIGHVASVFCLIPYFAWRNVHALHHRWVGVIDKDPTQRDLLKLRSASPSQIFLFRIVWKLWLPIPLAKFLFEVFWG